MTIIEFYLFPEKVHMPGSGDYEGEDFQSGTAEVVASGSEDSKHRLAHALTEHVRGSGDWGAIFGDPIIGTAIFGRLLPLRDHEGQAATGLTSVPVCAQAGTEARET